MHEALALGAGWFLTFVVIHILLFHYTYVQDCFKLILKPSLVASSATF